MCARKEVCLKYPFDERTFPEFHAYDLDFCLSVFPTYRVCVTLDIKIKHFSLGSLNASWVYNSIKIYDKWQKKLPATTKQLTAFDKSKLELRATLAFTIVAVSNQVNRHVTNKYILKSVLSLFSLGILEKRNRSLVKSLALALIK
jgi:hypothetical protein